MTYSSTQVCGLKGASVVLPCRYDYPWGHVYRGGQWYKEQSGRVSDHRNSRHPDCSLTLDNLSDDHAGIYKFRFYTSLHSNWITGLTGIRLSVTGDCIKRIITL